MFTVNMGTAAEEGHLPLQPPQLLLWRLASLVSATSELLPHYTPAQLLYPSSMLNNPYPQGRRDGIPKDPGKVPNYRQRMLERRFLKAEHDSLSWCQGNGSCSSLPESTLHLR